MAAALVSILYLLGGIVRNMLGKVVTISSIVAMLLLAILLYTTAPATAGPLGILIVFILMYVSALGVLTFFLYGASRVVARLSRSITVKRPLETISFSRSYYFSSVIALVPVMFIGMKSVGEVGVYEILLVMTFAVIACIYIAKRTN
jgi:hypothetical protein